MKRLNFTLDDETITLLNRIAEQYYHGNKSLAIDNSLRLGEPNPCAFPLAKRGSLKEGGFKYPAIGFSTLPRS